LISTLTNKDKSINMTANVLHDIIDDLIYTQQVLPKSEIRTIFSQICAPTIFFRAFLIKKEPYI